MTRTATHHPAELWPGTPYPLGATWDGEGVNFTLYYSDPGFSIVPNLQEDQTVNFAYTLTAPWTPPQ